MLFILVKNGSKPTPVRSASWYALLDPGGVGQDPEVHCLPSTFGCFNMLTTASYSAVLASHTAPTHRAATRNASDVSFARHLSCSAPAAGPCSWRRSANTSKARHTSCRVSKETDPRGGIAL